VRCDNIETDYNKLGDDCPFILFVSDNGIYCNVVFVFFPFLIKYFIYLKKGRIQVGIEFAKLKISQVISKNPGYSQIKTRERKKLSVEINNENICIFESLSEYMFCFKYALI
jgi:hypothetical protein